MNEQDVKKAIETALQTFPNLPLADAAAHLFEVLGYTSDRELKLSPNTLDTFVATFAQGETLNDHYALPGEWKSIDFLFQLTDDEIRAAGHQQFLLQSQGTYNRAVINSFLFFALELQGNHYTRTVLAGITRALNRLFDKPVIVLFRHAETLTLAVINRRPHKRDEGKFVLEKVTLIQDIQCRNTHRAHIEILFDLSLAALHTKHGFTNFVEL
jgi:adenine-specific DNA-methyltransferase